MSNFAIIVDGYSTGAGLAKEFSKYDISCIHVQSQANIPKVYAHTYFPGDYSACFTFQNNSEILVKKLQHYEPQFVIVGAECGVELSDHLAEKLDLPGNDINLSACRRNKYLMMQKIKEHGIQVIPSFQASTMEEAIIWASTQKTWPLIVKPLTSAGGEGVKICENLIDVSIAYSDIMSTKTNMLGFKNQAVLLQHYIYGEEYVVNTVSYEGKHKLCELWNYTRYTRPGGRQIYDTAKVINYDPVTHSEVFDYSIKILDALGIKYGPAHVEIIKNEDGCFLIELGARLMGANLPFTLMAKCITTPQALLTIASSAFPDQFKENQAVSYRVIQPMTAIFMVSDYKGIIGDIKFIDEIRSLKSFFDMKLAVRVGDKLHETIDYQTSPGMIYLSHPDPKVIEEDKAIIRSLEKKMFEVENLIANKSVMMS